MPEHQTTTESDFTPWTGKTRRRAVCPCGWAGPWRDARLAPGVAETDGQEHEDTHREDEP